MALGGVILGFGLPFGVGVIEIAIDHGSKTQSMVQALVSIPLGLIGLAGLLGAVFTVLPWAWSLTKEGVAQLLMGKAP